MQFQNTDQSHNVKKKLLIDKNERMTNLQKIQTPVTLQTNQNMQNLRNVFHVILIALFVISGIKITISLPQ